MATLFTHAFSAVVIHAGRLSKRKSFGVLLIGAISAALPDIDVITFSFGIPYGSMWGHRGFTHSIFFAVIWSGFVALILRNIGWKISFYWTMGFLFLCTASHGVLDAMTTGGKGVAFFAPWDTERYFLPWRWIKVSPIGITNFKGEWAKAVLLSEFYLVWIPGLLFIFLRWISAHLKWK
ncbi:UNVERIFIED_CONTAM: hypothetical protein GTU68_035463 [Idotea baltica]|nr:hypothetical protein [Idotea baltica]